ncbi:sugar phosphate isomerase/epimerase [bacterium]|nr:sugar phosphate isomerase/epimerase [bacterium]
MPNYRIGNHTYIFHQYGYNPVEQLDEIFDIVADAGFEAIELSPPFLEINNYEEQIRNALHRTGLGFVGASNGQPLWDVEQRDSIISSMEIYSDKLAVFGEVLCGTSCSGKRYAQRTETENDQVIQMWTEVAEMFRSKGITLNYHTHGESIEDIRHVTENVPADLLPLGPDLDWLRVGEVDPEEFIREYADRLVMMHVRDYHIGGDRTEALGEGDADYRRLGQLLEEVKFDGEFVVELAIPGGKQPTCPVAELLKKSREHLRETIG